MVELDHQRSAVTDQPGSTTNLSQRSLSPEFELRPPAPHQHSIKPALLKHAPHLSQLSDLAYMKWTHTYSTQLLTSRLLTSCSVLCVSYVCLSLSVTPARFRCRPEVCAYHVIHEFLARKPSSVYHLTF